MAKFELLKKTKHGAYYHVSNASISLLNAIRRTINISLPSFAITEVAFFGNTSAMFNEYVGHRIGLIPLKFDENASTDAKITFTLEASGPTVVYSKDLKTTDDKIIPALGHIPIMVLGDNQSLRLEAVAQQGNAVQHARFQNSHASYSHYPDLKIKGSKADAMTVLPKGVIDENGKIINPERLDIDVYSENVTVMPKENEFILLIESYNTEEPTAVLQKAITLLKNKAEELKTELK